MKKLPEAIPDSVYVLLTAIFTVLVCLICWTLTVVLIFERFVPRVSR